MEVTSNKGGVKICYEGFLSTKKAAMKTRIGEDCSRKRAPSCKGAILLPRLEYGQCPSVYCTLPCTWHMCSRYYQAAWGYAHPVSKMTIIITSLWLYILYIHRFFSTNITSNCMFFCLPFSDENLKGGGFCPPGPFLGGGGYVRGDFVLHPHIFHLNVGAFSLCLTVYRFPSCLRSAFLSSCLSKLKWNRSNAPLSFFSLCLLIFCLPVCAVGLTIPSILCVSLCLSESSISQSPGLTCTSGGHASTVLSRVACHLS